LKLLLTDVFSKTLVGVLRDYADIIKNAADKFTQAIALLNNMRVGEARVLFSEVIKLLDKSGELKTTIEEGIAATSLDPGFKEEVLVLVNMIDEIGDYIKESSRELTILPFLELPERVRRGLVELAKTVSQSISILTENFTNFIRGNYERVDEYFKEIIDLEEKADEIELQNRGVILDMSDLIKPYALQLLVYNLNKSLETITDLCARTASRVRLIVKAWLS